MVFFFFKQKTAYEMRISDWSSDVCSSDLDLLPDHLHALLDREERPLAGIHRDSDDECVDDAGPAQDDVHMAVGDRVERSRVKTHALLGHRLSSSDRKSVV